MAEISNNPQAQVEKKITEIFQKVITECLLYKGEDAEEHFKIKMDEAYENVLKNKDFGFHPNKIILLEENKFPFIKEIVKKAFPNIEIIDDDNYDFILSEGAALYAQRLYSKDIK